MADPMKYIERIEAGELLSRDEYIDLIEHRDQVDLEVLYGKARKARERFYGNDVYLRGLIEISNYCKNNCYYCGIRAGNQNAERYRLGKEDILDCCKAGYALGYRTFVLQGGEDVHYQAEDVADIVRAIRKAYPDCAITLSLGEFSKEVYRMWYEAGADRYLLRHETANEAHYQMLHPKNLSLKNRMDCLKNLKAIGFQTGSGFMVGSPGQTAACIADDLIFLSELKPQMIGIGPFLPHHDTPFALCEKGSLELTVFLLAILRLMFPDVLLPATTALGTIAENGRELGLKAGANVIMPNLSPAEVRKKYLLYDNKVCFGDEAAEARASMEKRIESAGCLAVYTRGDYIGVS